jgi:phosphate transport system ATP-binding protein
MSDDAKYELTDLKAWYGDERVLHGITMDVPAKGVTALIGPSGCGKSTMLRCLNRMHELVDGARCGGEILLDGIDIYADEIDPVLVRRNVGMVFQKPNPFPSMSVRENVLAGLKMTDSLDESEADAIVERALRRAALWDEVKGKLDQPGDDLSGGQQQRLCIARTIAPQPQVVLMDEPASALDPVATKKVESLIGQLAEDYTVIVVTHSMQQAQRVSDKTAFLYLGELVEFGDTARLFSDPDEEKTAAYIRGEFG